jgi:acetyl-CoA carboxylase carboxyl transferase subunit alpha
MLQYAIYSVISPEGCASILWKTAEHTGDAADAMGITASRLKSLGLVDRIVAEPVGGAHRDSREAVARAKKALQESLIQISNLSVNELVERRLERLMGYGRFKEQPLA